MLTALLIAAGVVTYLNIGYWWGRLSWKTWREQRRSFSSFLCFPASHITDTVGDGSSNTLLDKAPVANFDDDKNYTTVMAFVWPAKLAWNTVFCAIGAIFEFGVLIGRSCYKPFQLVGPIKPFRRLVSICTSPIATLSKLRSILPKRQPKKLPPPLPEPNEFSVDEYHNLLVERDKIDARLKELEDHPDRKRLLRLPRRF